MTKHVTYLFPESVSFDEFCRVAHQIPLTTESDIIKAFRKIDINGDGYISNSELKKMLTTVSV